MKRGDAPGKWRYVTAVSGIVALVQVILASQVYAPTSSDKGSIGDVAIDDEADEGQSFDVSSRPFFSRLTPCRVVMICSPRNRCPFHNLYHALTLPCLASSFPAQPFARFHT